MDLFLLNTEGLITLHRNKCDSLKENTNLGDKNSSKIIAITETWATHTYNEEYKKTFEGYNVKRSDRKDKKGDAVDDPEHLNGRGGVMLLTTPDIPITVKLEFSNGNCEVLIVYLKTIDTVVVVMYRPSGKNFS